MNNAFAMAVCQTFDDLFEQALGHIFLKPASPPDIVEQVSTRTHFDHEEYVFFSLEVLKESDDVLVSGPFEHDHFLHDLFSLGLIREALLINRLHRTKALRYLMHRQVYFSKRTFPKDFANSIKLNGCIRSGLRFSETQLNHPSELADLFLTRSQTWLGFLSHYPFGRLRSKWCLTGWRHVLNSF